MNGVVVTRGPRQAHPQTSLAHSSLYPATGFDLEVINTFFMVYSL